MDSPTGWVPAYTLVFCLLRCYACRRYRVCRFKTHTVAFLKRHIRTETDRRRFKSPPVALPFVYPLETLYFPLPIRLGTSAIAAAETAANESASKVFSCLAFYNEDKLKICGEIPVYKLNYFSQVIRSFSFQGFPCICGCSGFRFVRMNGGYCFYQSVSFSLK